MGLAHSCSLPFCSFPPAPRGPFGLWTSPEPSWTDGDERAGSSTGIPPNTIRVNEVRAAQALPALIDAPAFRLPCVVRRSGECSMLRSTARGRRMSCNHAQVAPGGYCHQCTIEALQAEQRADSRHVESVMAQAQGEKALIAASRAAPRNSAGAGLSYDALLADARKCLGASDTTGAEIVLKKARGMRPTGAEVHDLLAELAKVSGRPSAYEEHSRLAFHYGPTSVREAAYLAAASNTLEALRIVVGRLLPDGNLRLERHCEYVMALARSGRTEEAMGEIRSRTELLKPVKRASKMGGGGAALDAGVEALLRERAEKTEAERPILKAKAERQREVATQQRADRKAAKKARSAEARAEHRATTRAAVTKRAEKAAAGPRRVIKPRTWVPLLLLVALPSLGAALAEFWHETPGWVWKRWFLVPLGVVLAPFVVGFMPGAEERCGERILEFFGALVVCVPAAIAVNLLVASQFGAQPHLAFGAAIGTTWGVFAAVEYRYGLM